MSFFEPPESFLNDLYTRLEIESSKYLDIQTIYNKLRQQNSLKQLFDVLFSIFSNEHSFTLRELEKLSQNNKDININEHYKMNTHIFKSNL